MKKHADETFKEYKARKKQEKERKAAKRLADAQVGVVKRTRNEIKAAEARAIAEAEKEYERENRWDYKIGKNGKPKSRKEIKDPRDQHEHGCLPSGTLLSAVELAILAGDGLNLDALRVANVARSESKDGFDHPLEAWSVAEWANAMQSEAGEAGNYAKKLLRIRYKTKGNKKGDRSERKLLRCLAQEVADAVVYADLFLASEGISLSAAVRDTFNRKSKEIGFKFKL